MRLPTGIRDFPDLVPNLFPFCPGSGMIYCHLIKIPYNVNFDLFWKKKRPGSRISHCTLFQLKHIHIPHSSCSGNISRIYPILLLPSAYKIFLYYILSFVNFQKTIFKLFQYSYLIYLNNSAWKVFYALFNNHHYFLFLLKSSCSQVFASVRFDLPAHDSIQISNHRFQWLK